MNKMLILRGNAAAKAGIYPDEQGNKIEWPIGALHVEAAEEYAKRKGFSSVTNPTTLHALEWQVHLIYPTIIIA